MTWWTRRPSLTERLVTMMQEDRQQQLQLMEHLLDQQAEQARAIQGYLKLFTDVPKPEIRVMQDVDEIGVEQRLAAKRKLADQKIDGMIPRATADQWMKDLTAALDAEKQAMTDG